MIYAGIIWQKLLISYPIPALYNVKWQKRLL